MGMTHEAAPVLVGRCGSMGFAQPVLDSPHFWERLEAFLAVIPDISKWEFHCVVTGDIRGAFGDGRVE